MKYRKKKWARAIAPALCAFLLATEAFGGTLCAATTYYNAASQKTITKGLTYEASTRITDAGLLDVYVLKVNLDNPNLSLETIQSQTEYGLKETTSKLVNDNGAIAGINGDFFGVAGQYSISMGVEVANGQLLSINEASNGGGNGNATFFMDKNGNPFIDYMRTEVHFMNGGHEDLKIRAVNKVFDLGVPAILTTAAMETTAELDARLQKSYKLVCQDGQIQYISKLGETVTIPPNGYVVIFNEITAAECLSKFKIGQKAEFFLRPTIDIGTIQNAITGAGKILINGKVANDGGTVVGGRNPRTAVGISQDQKTVILMAIDGRGQSVGASQDDIAALMLEYGAYNAMHLDGGGSTTMVVGTADGAPAEVVNKVSESSQRKVINALGVMNNAPVGGIVKVVAEPAFENVIKGSFVTLNVYGLDEFSHKLEIPADQISYSGSPGSGAFSQGSFIPGVTGRIELYATYNGMKGTAVIYSHELGELTPTATPIHTYAGGTAALGFRGIARDGQSVSLDAKAVVYEVYPADLGKVENGIFTAAKMGTGWIQCTMNQAVAYIPIYATLYEAVVTDFENKLGVSGLGYPDGISATAAYTADIVRSGTSALALNYSFKQSTATQAAYAVFEPALPLQNAYKIRASVYGDASGHWLRGKIVDAKGTEYTVDFANPINWTGWKEVEASIPTEAVKPVTLSRIYVASVTQFVDAQNAVYIDDIRIMSENNLGQVTPPQGTVYQDYLRFAMDDAPAGGYDITFLPSLYAQGKKEGDKEAKPEGYADARKQAINASLNQSFKAFYMTNEDLRDEAGLDVTYNNGSFNTILVKDNLLAIAMNTQKGGIMASDVSQWSKIKDTIANSPAKNIVIYTDIRPSSFSQAKEYQLFHQMLAELAKNGKTIFVLSDEGQNNSATTLDGVRYINAGKLYQSDGKVNGQFSLVRIRIDGNTMKYCFETVK